MLVSGLWVASTRLFIGLTYTDTCGDPDRIAEVSAFNDRVYDRGLALLRRYADPTLPVDVRAEGHTRADAGSLAYRRLLADVYGSPRPRGRRPAGGGRRGAGVPAVGADRVEGR